MALPLKIISVPKVTPIKTGGPTSFSGVLKLEKSIDALFSANGLGKYEVPRASVPRKILEPGFEDAKTLKLPLSELYGPGTKGSVYALHVERPGQDYFALFTPKGHRLAVRQESGDYPQGFFWSNYQVK